MDFGIGDVVKHVEVGKIGIVQMIDGVAVWVRWGCGEINHSNCMQLEILDKSACAQGSGQIRSEPLCHI